MNRAIDIDASVLEGIASGEGTLSQRVYQSLKQAIITLDFPPGAAVRKAPICEHLGVSRAPVSEAISRLGAEGLVDIVAQSGTHVSYLSLDDLHEASFLRSAIEAAAIQKITGELNDDQKRQLSRNLRMQEFLMEDGDFQGFYEADEEFHAILLNCTGFQRLASFAESVSLQYTRARMVVLPSPGRVADTIDEHKAIFDAVCGTDKEAARHAIVHHLAQLMPRLHELEATRPELFR